MWKTKKNVMTTTTWYLWPVINILCRLKWPQVTYGIEIHAVFTNDIMSAIAKDQIKKRLHNYQCHQMKQKHNHNHNALSTNHLILKALVAYIACAKFLKLICITMTTCTNVYWCCVICVISLWYKMCDVDGWLL